MVGILASSRDAFLASSSRSSTNSMSSSEDQSLSKGVSLTGNLAVYSNSPRHGIVHAGEKSKKFGLKRMQEQSSGKRATSANLIEPKNSLSRPSLRSSADMSSSDNLTTVRSDSHLSFEDTSDLVRSDTNDSVFLQMDSKNSFLSSSLEDTTRGFFPPSSIDLFE